MTYLSAMDRTPELPTQILHNILSRLSTKTAARTSLLSKPWLKACSTNPHLSFDESDFNPHLSFGESDFNPHLSFDESDFNPHLSFDESYFQTFERKFLRIVDNTLERYRHENLPISTFKLCISFSDQTDCDGLVDKWLDIVAEKEVSHVALLAKSTSGRYTLSAYTIFAMESLQELELNHCKLLKLKPILFDDSKIKCRNLKNLSLHYVTVPESTLDSLLSCCSPHIMMISLHYCFGFSRIRASHLPNLLSLNILFCPIEEVHIVDAPKLLSFEYVNKDKLEPACYSYGLDIFLRSFNIDTCQNLRRVEFVKATMDDTILFQLIQKLPFIKELSLSYCKCLKIMKISSSTLEVCSISNCVCLMQAIFDAPNLLSFTISGQYRLPSLSFECVSRKCRISIDHHYLWDTESFINLKRSLVELNDYRVEVTTSNILFRSFSSKSLRASGISDHHPTPQVENLTSIPGYLSHEPYSTYFDAIFLTCWPKSLTVQCDEEFKKFLRQQLLKKYQWRRSKCTWKEYLINAEIEYKKKIEDNWMTLDRKMLAAKPDIIEEIHTIRFKQA